MTESSKTVLICDNPQCRKQFEFPTPEKPGGYSVQCPHCKWENHFTVNKFSGHKSSTSSLGLQADGSYKYVCSNSGCKKTVLVPSKFVNIGYNKVCCPNCKAEHEFNVEPSENDLLKCKTSGCKGRLEKPLRGDGIYNAVCHECGIEYSLLIQNGLVVKAIMKTPPPPPPPHQWPMKLVVGHFINKREYELSKGTHYVGRYDEENNSDFAIKDKYASKRSIKIEVNLNGESLLYKLTVEKATNPVYHNNKELSVGDVVYISYGDTIKLGKTLIRVEKCRQK